MTKAQRARVLIDGTILLLVGSAAGIPFAAAITRGWGEEAVRGWRVAHTSLLLGGVLYLAIAAVGSELRLGGRAAALLSGLLRVWAYALGAALLLGAAVGARGLEPVGPGLHMVVFAVFTLSVPAFLATSGLLWWGAYAACRRGVEGDR